ncbi:MAG: hypothetical protein ACYDHH_32890, partial [Solirubrobacteraceae bacterium]
IASCAASAGAHAGIVPEHWREVPQRGIAFILAVMVLAATAAALRIRSEERRIGRAAALLFAGLIVAWEASRITGIPVIQPQAEPVDAVGLPTKLVEVLGLAFAL